jgi:aspartyl/asparaginyl beta-hydroxylase (cupin superfamily)
MINDVDGALAAMRSGNVKQAFDFLKSAHDAAPLSDNALFALAHAARSVGDYKTCLETIDSFIKIDPTNVDAVLIKADAFKGLGESRFAAGFYQAFISMAQNMQSIPARLHSEIARAQQEYQSSAKIYEEHLREKIKAAGFEAGDGRSRIGQAIDIMLGKKTIYPQNPGKFYFPELPHIQYYDTKQFDWVPEIVEQADVIREELLSVISSEQVFDPYVQHALNAPTATNMKLRLMDDDGWSAYHLYKDSDAQADHMARCPKTLEILKVAPIPKIRSVSPSILFSKLTAGSHIPPHTGICNARILCHLPLIAPPGCWLRVGNQVREWTDGEMLIFDDTIEHEAKNPTSETRVVLIFDIWRPELREDERALVETIFNAVDTF